MNKQIPAALILFTIIGTASAQDADIKAYCSDLAQANSAGASWYQRCVATVQVKRNHQKKAADSARFTKDVDVRVRKNDWIIAYSDITREVKAAKNDDEKATASKKMDHLLADCATLFSPGECLEFRDEQK